MSTNTRLTSFSLDGRDMPVQFVETMQVKDGVECDVYVFVGDDSKDLAIVRVEQGSKTPLQLVLSGSATIEGFVSGEGTLTIRRLDGQTESFDCSDETGHLATFVKIGEVMQWHANGTKPLVFYEICEPAYQDGRFENLTEDGEEQ